jgi:Uma2 family endonuclease
LSPVGVDIYDAVVSTPGLQPWRPSIETYHRMADLGIPDDARVELLDGVIVEMTPISPEHAGLVDFLNRLLVESVDRSYVVRVQNPLSLGPRWEPQPDLALVRPGADRPYHPATADWVAEVAVRSLKVDRDIKRRAYAKAGIPEYWIIVVPERRVDVLSEPADGDYRRVESREHGRISSAVVAGLELDVDELWRAVLGG